MADILIRGMEIPKNCSSCKIVCWNYLEYGINGILGKLSTSESRDPNCPLVPLLKGHGRMIDLDALINELQNLFDKSEKDARFSGNRDASVTWNDAICSVFAAPIIIPAEGGTDNGN